jgi:translation elongation factor EF-1alpha
VLHVHAVAEECSIVRLTASIDKKTGAKSKKAPMFVKVRCGAVCVINICASCADGTCWHQRSVLVCRVRFAQSGAVIACIIECEQPVRLLMASHVPHAFAPTF